MRLTLLCVIVALAVEVCVSFKISGTDLSKDRLRRESTDGSDESAATSDVETPSDETPSGDTPAEETPSEADNPSGDTPADESPTGDTPAEETPSEAESPAGDTPADETPSEAESPSDDAPADETPSDETPTGETPSEADNPSVETPAGDTPADETPSEAESPAGDTPADETPSEAESPAGDTPADETPSEAESPAGDTPAGETPSDASSDGEAPTSDAAQGETPADDGSKDESTAAMSDGESDTSSAETTNEALDETSEEANVEGNASENADEQAEAAAAQGEGANGDGSGLEEDSVEPTSVNDNGVIVEKELNEEPEEDTSSEEADMQADEFDEEEHGETEEEIDNDGGDGDNDDGTEVEENTSNDSIEAESSSDASQEASPSGATDSEPAAPEEPEEDSLSETGGEVGAGVGDVGDDTTSDAEAPEAAPSEEAPEAVPSEGAPEAVPSEEVPEANPSEEVPEAAPSEEAAEAAPSEEVPEANPSEEQPEPAPSEEEPEAAPTEELPEANPSEEAPEESPTDGAEPETPTPDADNSEENPNAGGSDESPETPLPDTENPPTGEAKRRRKRVALRDPKKRWPRGIIPFSFRKGTSERTKKDATAAMKFVERHSCLRFEPYNRATQKAKLGHPGHAIFENKGYCASMVGMSWKKSGQSITCTNRFVFLHEIGHLAFLVHEQQGDNRKGIVRINYDNIKDEKLNEYKSLPESMTLNSTGYSTSAVTHYAPNINSKNGEHTLTVLNKAPGMQLSGIMYYTMAEINLGYKCQEEICPNKDINCVKDGYAVLKGDKCVCECTPGIDPATGCNEPKTKRVQASWGAGKVLMPKPEKGCPDGFQDSITIESEGDQAGGSSAVHHLAGSFGSTVSLPLCVSDGSGSGEWPMGRYCFISDDGECPSELFEKGKVTLGQKDGSDLDISFCCRDDGFPFEEVRMKNDKPFVLFQKHKKCQVIEDMYIYAEHFKLDSTKRIVKSGTLPKSGGGGGYKISFYYCYYVPLNYGCGGVIDLTKENPEETFETPNFGKGNYPDSTMCTWIVSASEDKASILLNFDDETFCLEKGDHVDVHHNKIGQPSLRTTGKGYKPTVVTINKLMKIQFRSDLDVSCGGFKATVKMVTKEEQTYSVEDEGASYRGTVNYTHNNIPCLRWAEVTDCPHHPFATTDGADGLDGNYCRNPGNGLQPWCYVAKDNCERNYCDVSRISRPADNYADCDAITTADPKFCEDQTKAVRGCFKTCNVEVETPKPVTEITCKTPNAIEGASLVNEKGSYQVGEKAEYKCSSGDGGLEVVCTTTGEWTGGGYVCGDCPKGWVAFGDNCYLYQDEPLPFKKAKAVCKKFKSTIASVTSDEESDLLEVLGRETGKQWLGMHKGKWLDGSSSTYTKWAKGQPKKMKKKKNVVILGTLKKMQWKTVKARKKKPLYAFTCKKKAGARPCVDRLSNCEETLKLVPEACQNFSQNAWVVQQCRKTCGLCESKTCQVPEDMSNAVLTSPAGTVNVGEVITYECNEGYVVSEGALRLACTPSGLTNKAPSCIEKSTTTRLSNDIDIRPRAGSFSKLYSYTGSEDMYRIDADGTVIGWNFFIKYGGTVVFQVWRLVEGTELELVGQNEVTAEHYRPHTFNVPAAQQIPVRAGDRIGIWVPSGGAGVPYDTHAANGNSGLKLATAIRNKDEFVVTQSYEFKTYSPMKIGSFQAIVGPASP